MAIYMMRDITPKIDIEDISTYTLDSTYLTGGTSNYLLYGIIFDTNSNFYICQPAGNRIRKYSLSSGISYDISQGWSSTGQGITSNRGGGLWTDGTHFLSTGYDSPQYYRSISSYIGENGDIVDATKQYTLQISTSTSSSTSVYGICMSLDGKNMYLGFNDSNNYNYGGKSLWQYKLTTPFDLSTATKDVGYSINNFDLDISYDGQYLYVLSRDTLSESVGGNKIDQYKLSTPYSLSTKTLYKTLTLPTDFIGMFITPRDNDIILSRRNGDLYKYKK